MGGQEGDFQPILRKVSCDGLPVACIEFSMVLLYRLPQIADAANKKIKESREVWFRRGKANLVGVNPLGSDTILNVRNTIEGN
jgi:hypothetical protein